MNELQLVIIIFGTLLLFLLSGVWIGVGIGMAGVIAMLVFTHYPVGKMVAALSMGSLNSFVLVCLPGFILMGEILFRSGASKDLYTSISPWVARIPGKLLHSNIISCTLFAALSGSSAATAATPQARSSRDFRRLAMGTGTPACDPASLTHSSCKPTSWAFWKRSSGSLARHVWMTRSRAGGDMGCT